ncbi:MAG TPA: hypothetical protein ENH41_01095 [Candidatus Omnitrophica bacterium]|nr:hypothetical protein [Candidatus Omnitrophota bacterium]
MNIKQINRQIKRSIGLYCTKCVFTLLRVLPRWCVYIFAESTARIGYYIAVRHRRIAQESLRIAFEGKKTEKEIKAIIIGCFSAMVKGMLEVFASMGNPKILDKMVAVEGRENLDKALAKGKGVILVSAHFGNFPLLLTKLAILGYKVNVVVRKMRDEKADEYFRIKRDALGVKSIYSHPRNTCVQNSIDALRKNELVFMLMDQNFGTGGVFVDFFGRKAATATGPVVFALRTEAIILPVFIIGGGNNTHRLIIEKELELRHDSDRQLVIQNGVADITKIIEKYIRQYPAEWGWIHRRWKTQPKKTKEDSDDKKN